MLDQNQQTSNQDSEQVDISVSDLLPSPFLIMKKKLVPETQWTEIKSIGGSNFLHPKGVNTQDIYNIPKPSDSGLKSDKSLKLNLLKARLKYSKNSQTPIDQQI